MATKHIVLGLCLLISVSLIQGRAYLHRPNLAKAIPNQYIVVFKEGATLEQRNSHIANLNGRLLTTYDLPNFAGYAARFGDDVLDRIRSSEIVDYVEADQIVQSSQSCVQQQDATWGIDRLDTAALSLQGTYTYSLTGTGVDAYIVDTGIYTEHEDFDGRAIWGTNYVGDGQDTDCNGHGTHVAGTIGSTTYGVAKNVTLIAVKVLGCDGSGTNSGVISGIEWVSKQASSRKKPSVANMSLGGGASLALDNALNGVINNGITFVVAAGNENSDACNTSPARVPGAVTVGATTSADVRASFSNYGSCVDVFAPGQSITSTWIGSTTATATISGTSMASPHTAGVAALLLEYDPSSTPAEISDQITDGASSGILDLNCRVLGTCKDSPNKMLFSPCK